MSNAKSKISWRSTIVTESMSDSVFLDPRLSIFIIWFECSSLAKTACRYQGVGGAAGSSVPISGPASFT